MIDLLAIYDCPTCGEVLEDQVYYFEHIDTENDEIYPAHHCSKCNSAVTPQMREAQPVFMPVDHERWLWAMGYYDALIAGEDYEDEDEEDW